MYMEGRKHRHEVTLQINSVNSILNLLCSVPIAVRKRDSFKKNSNICIKNGKNRLGRLYQKKPKNAQWRPVHRSLGQRS